jgi:hypothetical protein
MLNTLLLSSLILITTMADPIRFDLTRSMPNYLNFNRSESPFFDKIHDPLYNMLENGKDQI